MKSRHQEKKSARSPCRYGHCGHYSECLCSAIGCLGKCAAGADNAPLLRRLLVFVIAALGVFSSLLGGLLSAACRLLWGRAPTYSSTGRRCPFGCCLSARACTDAKGCTAPGGSRRRRTGKAGVDRGGQTAASPTGTGGNASPRSAESTSSRSGSPSRGDSGRSSCRPGSTSHCHSTNGRAAAH